MHANNKNIPKYIIACHFTVFCAILKGNQAFVSKKDGVDLCNDRDL
jgi:hypothetical protein